jgi:hypothetical protein
MPIVAVGPPLIFRHGFGLAFAAHIPDERSTAVVHMHMLNTDQLRATVPEAPPGWVEEVHRELV